MTGSPSVPSPAAHFSSTRLPTLEADCTNATCVPSSDNSGDAALAVAAGAPRLNDIDVVHPPPVPVRLTWTEMTSPIVSERLWVLSVQLFLLPVIEQVTVVGAPFL